MFEELNLNVVGSFARSRTAQPPLFSPKYKISLTAKVTAKKDGSPIEGLEANNFTIRLSGLESSDLLGDFLFLPSTDNTLFPGFYRFTKERVFNDNTFDLDLYLLSGLLFCIRVDYKRRFATTVINLAQIVFT
jgi:hypothetical protein